MADEMIGSPVKEFVKDFLAQFNDGIKEQGFRTCSEHEAELRFELNVSQVKSGQAGVRAWIVNAKGEMEDANSQKVIAYAKRMDGSEEVEIRAKIAEATTKELEQIAKGSTLARQSSAVGKIVRDRVDRQIAESQ